MDPLAEGHMAPGFTLLSVEGEPVSLNKLISEKKTILLVFLRHLG
ncbi:MAG: hypothetical protein AAGU04_01170 [Anaerolineaceae bacterium]